MRRSPRSEVSEQEIDESSGIQVANHLFKRRTLSGRHFSVGNFQELRNAKKREQDVANMNSVITRSLSRVNQIIKTSSLVDLNGSRQNIRNSKNGNGSKSSKERVNNGGGVAQAMGKAGQTDPESYNPLDSEECPHPSELTKMGPELGWSWTGEAIHRVLTTINRKPEEPHYNPKYQS